MAELYRVENLGKTYAGDGAPVEVLRGINLEVLAGDSIGVTGPSGAGKSTLLHIMGLMDADYTGGLAFAGKDVASMSGRDISGELRRRIGFLFQFHYLVSELSVYENVLLPLKIAGTPDDGRVESVLESLDIVDKRNAYPHELSGGQKQRAALARALVKNPGVLFCDEPTGNLDTVSGEAVKSLLAAKHEELGFTLILVTHNKSLCGITRRRFEMIDGRLLAS